MNNHQWVITGSAEYMQLTKQKTENFKILFAYRTWKKENDDWFKGFTLVVLQHVQTKKLYFNNTIFSYPLEPTDKKSISYQKFEDKAKIITEPMGTAEMKEAYKKFLSQFFEKSLTEIDEIIEKLRYNIGAFCDMLRNRRKEEGHTNNHFVNEFGNVCISESDLYYRDRITVTDMTVHSKFPKA